MVAREQVCAKQRVSAGYMCLCVLGCCVICVFKFEFVFGSGFVLLYFCVDV